MTDDIQLLRRFALENSEEAFTELVRQRIDFVYGIALRVAGGDAHLARDATQRVFLGLARDAKNLSRRPVLVSWLHTSARFAAAKAVRAQVRWRNHQQKAHAMNQLLAAGTTPAWEEIRPVLDEAIGALGETDRTAILLRYFEDRSMAQVGSALGLAENAARMRVERALDKLRAGLARRGITSTAAALMDALAHQPAMAAPSGLAALVSGAVLAGVTPGSVGSAAAIAAGTFMTTTKFVLGIAGIAAILGFYLGVSRVSPAPPAPVAKSSAPAAENKIVPAAVESDTPAEAPLVEQPVPAAAVAASRPTFGVPPLPAGIIETTMTGSMGRVTPANAIVTEAWAARTENMGEQAQSIVFSPQSQPVADDLYASLPESLRREIPSAEYMWVVHLMMIGGGGLSKVSAIQFNDQEELSPDSAVVETSDLYPDGIHLGIRPMFRGADGMWRRKVMDTNVASIKGKTEQIANEMSAYIAAHPSGSLGR